MALRPLRGGDAAGYADHQDAPDVLEGAQQVGKGRRGVAGVVLGQGDQRDAMRPRGVAARNVAEPVVVRVVVEGHPLQVGDEAAEGGALDGQGRHDPDRHVVPSRRRWGERGRRAGRRHDERLRSVAQGCVRRPESRPGGRGEDVQPRVGEPAGRPGTACVKARAREAEPAVGLVVARAPRTPPDRPFGTSIPPLCSEPVGRCARERLRGGGGVRARRGADTGRRRNRRYPGRRAAAARTLHTWNMPEQRGVHQHGSSLRKWTRCPGSGFARLAVAVLSATPSGHRGVPEVSVHGVRREAARRG